MRPLNPDPTDAAGEATIDDIDEDTLTAPAQPAKPSASPIHDVPEPDEMDVDEAEVTPTPTTVFAAPPGRPRKSTGRDIASPVSSKSGARLEMDRPCECGDAHEGAFDSLIASLTEADGFMLICDTCDAAVHAACCA